MRGATSCMLVFEALGSSMIVADERIDEGLDALNGKGKLEKFQKLMIERLRSCFKPARIDLYDPGSVRLYQGDSRLPPV